MVKNNKGHIVEIASMSSFLGVGVFSDYSAGKTALISFTESTSLLHLFFRFALPYPPLPVLSPLAKLRLLV